MLEVNVNGVKLEFVKSFSYLGITIDSKLQFNEHIKMRLGMQDTKYICYQESDTALKGIYPEFQVIRGLSQKIPADLLSYDKIQS